LALWRVDVLQRGPLTALSEISLSTGVLGVSYGIGLFCSDRVQRIYAPIILFTGAYKNQNDFIVPFRRFVGTVLGTKIPMSVDHFYVNMAHIDKVIRISQRAGVRAAFWAGFLSAAGSFVLTRKWRESRPLVVDIAEGAILGSAIGCCSLYFSKDLGSRGVQWITAIGVGFVAGMIASSAGSISGYVTKRFFDK
jgi:hypothetical protein